MASTIILMCPCDVPPGPAALSATSLHFAALCATSAADCITSLTRAATSSLPSSPLRRVPTRHTSHASVALAYWSADPGQNTMGTPAATPSQVELHPPCVRKQPTARWPSTSSRGGQAEPRRLGGHRLRRRGPRARPPTRPAPAPAPSPAPASARRGCRS
jgi:hypothetical protein